MRKIETGTRSRRRWTNRVATALIGAAAAGMALVVPAQAVPLFPGGPDIALPTLPTLPGLPAPAAPLAPLPPVEPQVGPANFSAPSLNPSEGEVVGVAQPIIIRFDEAIDDRATAERAIKISSSPKV